MRGSVFGRHFGIPFHAFAFFFESAVCGSEAVAGFHGLPGRVDLACECVADQGISFIGRGLREHPERFIQAGRSDFCRG